MATTTFRSILIAKGTLQTIWTITGTNDGQPESPQQYYRRSVQVTGTFSTGTVLIEGSDDGGTTWFTLSDYQGFALSFAAAGIKPVQEITQLIRPRASVAVTSVVVTLVSLRSS